MSSHSSDQVTKKKTICGIPRWLFITVSIILLLGVAFAAIGLPILLNTIWKSEKGEIGNDTDASDNTSGDASDDAPSDTWIDPDTPKSLHTRKMNGKTYKLVFSDEFNKDGRTFRPGDDKVWEAVDLYYWQTGDLEYYHPDQITTKNGTMRIRMEKKRHGQQDYVSGMVQTWNKFCFRGGYIEVNVSLPGSPYTPGLWPAVWTMGNLGRAGYGASTDGLWPYSYNSCDIGVLPRQGINASYSRIPGQRLNACLCSDQDTPSPRIGRGAPEIDVLEASAGEGDYGGAVSQSHQFAPFDVDYVVRSEYFVIHNSTSSFKNYYTGAELQQMVSAKTKLRPDIYENRGYETFGFEYTPGPTGSVTWYVGNKKRATLDARAVGPNSGNGVSQRLISEEPMYIVMNLGMSYGFSEVRLDKLTFPATMYIDYVRIYQDPDKIDITCDPKDRPTRQYIKDHPELYTNPLLHHFNETKYPLPQYSLEPKCKS